MNKQQRIQVLKQQKISVGILSSDWMKFPETLATLADHNVRLLHFDIADGNWSPLFTIGTMALKPFGEPFLKDVHLMVKDPSALVQESVALGADIITFQLESDCPLLETYQWMHSQTECIAGISLCPNTALEQLVPYLQWIDMIQLLTLDPRTGLKMDSSQFFERIQQLHFLFDKHHQHKIIAIDGSMTLELATQLQDCDIDWVVSGSAFFKSDDLYDTLEKWSFK
ncbi:MULTISPECIES: ribulose phosphate epimerase [unclassified Lonepinella]|uniref:ribulose phosphate epimerase n=1 Tax=unclassified Lonepinella TaxID=2642006 RepID=UPI0036DCE5B4